MLTERDLRETIAECKAAKPTAATCQLMASCYTILDHLFPEEPRSVNIPMYSMAADGSEFVRAARKADFETLLDVLDEHMDCIQALYPKEYESILRKLGE